MAKVSMAEIARKLGVSPTLVSLVLSGKGSQFGIKKETQESVRKLAAELNYVPNSVASSLRTGRTKIIGLIVPDISNPFFSRIARSIEDAASLAGYYLMVCSADEDTARENQLLHIIRQSQRAAGIIVCTAQTDVQPFSEMIEQNYPLVFIDRDLPGLNRQFVGVNNRSGAEKAVEHLIASGRKRIGMLSIGPSHLSSVRDRVLGWKDALAKAGMADTTHLLREVPFSDVDKATTAAVKELTQGPDAVDAIFTANNRIAISAINALRETGKSIPDQVALVSFDDIDVFPLLQPPLTAMAQPAEAIGREAAGLLLALINKSKSPADAHSIVLDAELKIRRSV
jgi:LacI family transcriptional regulator